MRQAAPAAGMSQKSISIYVIGPSSTGKTTLCNALSLKLGIPKEAYVTEVARQVMKQTGFSRDTISSLEMQKAIMEAHLQREEALDENESNFSSNSKFLIRLFDRSAIDPIVYAILTSMNEFEAQGRKESLVASDEFKKAQDRYTSPNAVVVLLKPVQEWIQDDGVRSLEDMERCLTIFRALLGELGVEYREFGEEERRLEGRVMRVMGFMGL